MNQVINDAKKKAFDEGYEKGRAEGAKITAEIEYKLSVKCNTLAEENEKLRAMETEFFRLRAQMDIVYLIFGGK